jgi:hypothetical protein
VFVAFAFGRLEVSSDLGLKCLGEHLLGSPASDLVEVEHELLTGGFSVVYPSHWCVLSAGVPAPVLPIDYSEGRYTASLTKSPIHNFRS